jgi:uncharacterized membrane protein
MTINLTTVGLSGSASGPTDMGTSMSTPITLSFIGVALIFVSGWLGGQMVHVYGVGIEGRK